MSPLQRRWRNFVYWMRTRPDWVFPAVMLAIGVAIVIAAGGPQHTASSAPSASSHECGTGPLKWDC